MKIEHTGPSEAEGIKVARKGVAHPTIHEDTGPTVEALNEELQVSDAQPDWAGRDGDRVGGTDEHDKPTHLSELKKVGLP